MNVNDTERMYSLLEMNGYESVFSPDQADIIVINSCSVREKPVHKIRSEVGRYKSFKSRKSFFKVGVAGCVAQQEKKKLFKDIPLLDFVVGTDAIDELPSILETIRQTEEPVVSARFKHQEPYSTQTLIRNPKVSTFVNITKGCNNFCSFCVVPFTRGRERSRNPAELVSDVQFLVERGVKEVTLLGQNVNSYRSDDCDFSDLLKLLAEDTNIERIRYTTSHPKDFNEKVLQVMKKYKNKICEYIHLPVQSGSTEVLERMNRGYSREEYLDKIKMVFDFLPNASLSTDIIVGFPGETEEQFEETCSLLKEVPYESLYAFKYSPRPYTKASRYPDQILEKEKSKRLHKLFQIHNEIAFNLAKKYIHQELPVLVESYDPSRQQVKGRSPQNKVTYFEGKEDCVGKTVKVKIIKAFPQTLQAVAV